MSESNHKPLPPPDPGPAKLLGGYATGNLTPAEQRELLESALHDQQLFDALMEDQALKDLLDTPGVKQDLIQSLTPRPSLWQRFREWATTPMGWASAGALTTAAVVLVMLLVRQEAPLKQQAARQVAVLPAPQTNPPEVIPPPPPAAAVEADKPATPQRLVKPPTAGPEREARGDRQEARVAVAENAAQAENPVMAEKKEKQQSPPAAAAVMEPLKDRKQMELARDAVAAAPAAPMTQATAPAAPPPAPMLAGAIAETLSMQYAVLKKDAADTYRIATSVEAGDEIRFEVTPSENGFVYLYRRNAAGGATAMSAPVAVRKGEMRTIPAEGSLAAAGPAYVLLLTRDMIAVPSAAVGSSFRAMAPGRRANQDRAKSAAAPLASLPEGLAKKADIAAGTRNRVAADTAQGRSVAVEIVVRGGQ